MTEFKETTVLGAGVIGASWTALFLASAGMYVSLTRRIQLPRVWSSPMWKGPGRRWRKLGSPNLADAAKG